MTNNVSECAPGNGPYEDFVSQGFRPGSHIIYKFRPYISVEELKEAQYGSTYHDRKSLMFEIGRTGVVSVTVDSVAAIFVDDEPEYGHPNWRVECTIVDSDMSDIPSSSRVNLYFVNVYGEDLEDGYIQLIADPDPDLNATFRYVEEP